MVAARLRDDALHFDDAVLRIDDREEELGHCDRHDIANWFRELQHYGFIVQTAVGHANEVGQWCQLIATKSR